MGLLKSKPIQKILGLVQNVSRNRLLFIADLFLIVISAFGSFALRLDWGPLFVYYLPQTYWLLAVSLLVKPIVFYVFGLYRRLWAYASTNELKIIVAAVSTASVFISVIIVTLRTINVITGFPRSTIPIDWLLTLLLTGGLRFAVRLLAETRAGTRRIGSTKQRILIVGAGDAGAIVVREMQKSSFLSVNPVCFLDDDPNKQKQQIYGVPVVGKLKDLPRVVTLRRIDEVVIAIPSAPGQVIRQVASVCQQKGIPFRTMPGIYELIGGKVTVNRLREVDITDLLRRRSVMMENARFGTHLSGRRVLVTGAGGSIGRELCRQIARWGPSMMILLGHGENSIFETFLDIQDNYPALSLQPVIADIRDLDRLTNLFETHQPQVIFHTAAHKHVPLMEVNVGEAVTNNVQGTRNLVEAALNQGVERLVMISTDKAIRPSSVYGATKRLAELVVLDAANRSGMPFSVVRFGNVLGSRGSVIPRFKQQIALGGPVTITHPDMERYFMTIPEAVHLVLQASAMGQGGEVYVLKMGDQIRIQELAEDLIRLSGFEPGKDIEIVYTGIRPGEKLSEELWDRWATYAPTSHPDIVLLADENIISGEPLGQIIDDLIHIAREGDDQSLVRILDEFIPGAAIRSTPPPDLTAVL